MRTVMLTACAVLVLAAACGKKKKAAPTSVEVSEPVAQGPHGVAPPPASGAGGDLAWNAVASPAPQSGPPFRHSFDPGPPAPASADPDAVIARYETECHTKTLSSACKELRRRVEEVLLADLVALRGAGQHIDRELYQIASRAETPQLACIGVHELGYASDRKPDDDAAILAALDNPSQSVREAVLGTSVPAVIEVRQRTNPDRRPTSGTCVDGVRDIDPGLAWAGGYPGARFRYFASSPALRWYTTSDPVETVLAYFAKSGRKAQTKDELAAAAQQQMIADATRLSQQAKPGEEEKLTQQMQQLAAKVSTDWSQPLRGIQGTGEIRYVMIAPNQAIAIFKDDVLHGTSIVAPQPNDPPPISTDLEKLKRDAVARQVLGF